MGSNKDVPEGWLDYSPIGKQIPGTVIICFKVPLKEEISRKVPESLRFTPSMLINQVPNLAGVIDVTNTPRYYNKQVFVDKGILHEKVLCPGHVVPPARVVESFQRAMQRMWAVAEAGGKLVGVHCTHGINRTGYLVCRFLIECCGFHPEDAIRIFGESRGHRIERQNYLSDLRTLTPSRRFSYSASRADYRTVEQQRQSYRKMDAHNGSRRPRWHVDESRRRAANPQTTSSFVTHPPPPHHYSRWAPSLWPHGHSPQDHREQWERGGWHQRPTQGSGRVSWRSEWVRRNGYP